MGIFSMLHTLLHKISDYPTSKQRFPGKCNGTCIKIVHNSNKSAWHPIVDFP